MNIKPIKTWLEHGNRDGQPNLVVLHATAGASAKSSIDHLRDKGLSYHYIIARDGKDATWTSESDGSEAVIFQCVPVENSAFHASTRIPVPGTDGGRVNKWAIGISLANIQNGQELYTEAQITALRELLAALKTSMPSLTYLTTHAVIQPWNRSDPTRIDGATIAAEFGFTWWKPSAADIKKYKPKD